MSELQMQLHCKVCDHKWFRRSEKLPRTCPKCGSYHWQTGRRRALRSEQLKNSHKRKISTFEKLVKELPLSEIQHVIPKLPTKTVVLKEIMYVPCGTATDIDDCVARMGEGNDVEISGRLAELATPGSWVGRTEGLSMSNGDRPDGIGPDSRCLFIPFHEFKGAFYPGLVVLAKLKYNTGATKCTLKTYRGKRLKANNPHFKGVEFDGEPGLVEATVWAICAGVIEKVFLGEKK